MLFRTNGGAQSHDRVGLRGSNTHLRGERPEQVIFHSDRGTQYASAQITAFAKAHRITRSMGYTGVCWDNALAESGDHSLGGTVSRLVGPPVSQAFLRLIALKPGIGALNRISSRDSQ